MSCRGHSRHIYQARNLNSLGYVRDESHEELYLLSSSRHLCYGCLSIFFSQIYKAWYQDRAFQLQLVSDYKLLKNFVEHFIIQKRWEVIVSKLHYHSNDDYPTLIDY
jgi:hypothetical protein